MQKAQDQHRAEPRRVEHVERVSPARLLAPLAATAHLIEADARDGAEQRETRDRGEDERQHVPAQRGGRQEDADQWIEEAEKHHVRTGGREILGTLPERRAQILDPDAPDLWRVIGIDIVTSHTIGDRAQVLPGRSRGINAPGQRIPDGIRHEHPPPVSSGYGRRTANSNTREAPPASAHRSTRETTRRPRKFSRGWEARGDHTTMRSRCCTEAFRSGN